MFEAWSEVPMVFVTRPRCPICRCREYITVRSEQGGDGSTMRKAVCRSCSGRYKIVVEDLPEVGKETVGEADT